MCLTKHITKHHVLSRKTAALAGCWPLTLMFTFSWQAEAEVAWTFYSTVKPLGIYQKPLHWRRQLFALCLCPNCDMRQKSQCSYELLGGLGVFTHVCTEFSSWDRKKSSHMSKNTWDFPVYSAVQREPRILKLCLSVIKFFRKLEK